MKKLALSSATILLLVTTSVAWSDLNLPCSPACGRNGRCKADHGNLFCKCEANWSGPACDQFICQQNPCGRGQCLHHPDNTSAYFCSCPHLTFGAHCEYEIGSAACVGNQCGGRGTCYGTLNGSYVCHCENGYFGQDCERRGIDPCDGERVQNCHGHGTCYSDVNLSNNDTYTTSCICVNGTDGKPLYWDDTQCEALLSYLNLCRVNPCANGGTCIPSTTSASEYSCECSPEWTGLNCSERFDVCEGHCRNGATCNRVHGGHYFECLCAPGYTGLECNATVTTTPPGLFNNCSNGGELVVEGGGGSVQCVCPVGFVGDECQWQDPCSVGWTGSYCHIRTLSSCSSIEGQGLCGDKGTCLEVVGGVMCTCDDGYSGTTCTIQECPSSCRQHKSNGVCESQCNVQGCGYDYDDCGFDDFFQSCPLAMQCQLAFNNGRCDVACNTPQCLFDGNDCVPPREACPIEEMCREMVEDGKCQLECLTSICLFDFSDCNLKSSNILLSGSLVFTLVSWDGRPFASPWEEEFLGNLSLITNSLALLQEVRLLTGAVRDAVVNADDRTLVYRVAVKLDITNCSVQCLRTVQEGLENVRASLAQGRSTIGPFSVSDVDATTDEPPNNNSTVIGATVAVLVLVVATLVLIVIVLGKRRKIRAKIWRPHSPTDTDHTSPLSNGTGVDGAVATAMTKEEEAGTYIEMGTKKSKMESDERHVEWDDDTVPLASDPASPSKQESSCVIGQLGRDRRQWTMAHAGDVGRLVEQYRRQNGSTPNVNTPGPGGFTPLMLAVIRRPGAVDCVPYQSRSSSESSSDDQTALLPPFSRGATPRHLALSPVDRSVANLIEARADLDATNDYSQTALQLAAAASRPEYVDILLEAGANPNIPDNWGQTALHAAIGAGAEGAFMVLLNCPRTKVNVKCDGGITPLMSAVKMMNSFMVKQLLKKDSEVISSTDSEGRTAVHWAAMVDNYDALRMLISRGPDTIKDAQDNKGQTALFLACREGSFLCVKHLLDCFANVTLLDHLDQSPLQVAMQKQYSDIVDLLRANTHGPVPYMRQMSSGAFNFTHNGYPPTSQQQVGTTSTNTKAKKKRTRPSSPNYPVSTTSPPDPFNQTPSGGYSNPTPPGGYSNPTPPGGYSNPTPPGGYSNPTPPGGYSNPTPPGGYSNHPTPPYDHQHPIQEADVVAVTTPIVSNGVLQHPSGLESSAYATRYPPIATPTDVMAPSSTRPLNHLYSHPEGPGGTPLGMGVNSPPQSGGSVTQSSPHSVLFHSPPDTNSPSSLTPSPEGRQTNIHATGMVYVEPSTMLGKQFYTSPSPESTANLAPPTYPALPNHTHLPGHLSTSISTY